jgi:hypothetical protein
MKYCKDCKHYHDHKNIPATCESPNLPKDLVTGSPKFALCTDMRYEAYMPNCGVDGRWFEFIEDADLDDLSSIPFGK